MADQGDSWKESEEGRRHVRRLLERAGVPLELEASAICREFVRSQHQKHKDILMMSKGVSYTTVEPQGDDEDRVRVREVDQVVTFSTELHISECTGIDLALQVPVECKYRHHVDWFAFFAGDLPLFKKLPTCTNLRGSQLARRIYHASMYFPHLMLAKLVGLRWNPGKGSGKGKSFVGACEEDLVGKAACQLYDFIYRDLEPDPVEPPIERDQAIENLAIFKEFVARARAKDCDWEDSFSKWLRENLTDDLCTRYREGLHEDDHFHFSVEMHVPVICVGGSLHRVGWDPLGGTSGFDDLDACIIAHRQHGWPGRLRSELMRRSPEVPCLLTTTKGLPSVLDLAFECFLGIRETLVAAPQKEIDRAYLEAAFSQKVERELTLPHEIDDYRSDLDEEDWDVAPEQW